MAIKKSISSSSAYQRSCYEAIARSANRSVPPPLPDSWQEAIWDVSITTYFISQENKDAEER